MDDILEAVPIDKYFELFKPKNGGEGGFIRVAINFSTESVEDAASGALLVYSMLSAGVRVSWTRNCFPVSCGQYMVTSRGAGLLYASMLHLLLPRS